MYDTTALNKIGIVCHWIATDGDKSIDAFHNGSFTSKQFLSQFYRPLK
jgi:hypothetical protein